MSTFSEQVGIDKVSLDKALDFLPYPFLVSQFRDGAQHNIFVNKKFVDEIGYTCEDIPTIGDWFRVAYPNKYYRNEIMHDWATKINAARDAGHDSVVKQAHISTKNNGQKWYEVKASVFNQINFVAFVNIDDEIKKEENLRKLNENKDRTLSILSHDLRGPLINLHSFLLLIKTGQLSSQETKMMLEKLTGQVFRMLEFLDTTLEWSKINFTELQVKREAVHSERLIQPIIDIYREACADKQIVVECKLDSSLALFTDPEIFSILFRNIFSNAIKYTPERGTIMISNEMQAGRYVVSVQNSGKGISQEKIGIIHSRLYESERGTIGEKGLGLGLRLCQQLLENIGGSLEIESDHSTSTIFRILL